MKINRLIQFAILLTGFLLAACSKNAVFEKNVDIKDFKWAYENRLLFETEIADTSSSYNININTRHLDLYTYQNIWVMVHTTNPDGSLSHQRIEVVLADVTGKWYGEGLNGIWMTSSRYKSNFKFKQPGLYRFELEQSMRINPLPAIMSMGLRIEKNTSNNSKK